MRFVTLALLALLVLVQGELWFGKGGVHRVMELQGKLQDQQGRQRHGAATATSSWPPRCATSRKASRWSRRRRAPSSAWSSPTRSSCRCAGSAGPCAPRANAPLPAPSGGWLQHEHSRLAAGSMRASLVRTLRPPRHRLRGLGRARHLARGRWPSCWRWRWWCATSASIHWAGRWPIGELAAVLRAVLAQPAVRRGRPADLVRAGRPVGLVAMAARAGGPTAGAAGADADAARAGLAVLAAVAAWPAIGLVPRTATPTPTCPGGTPSPPRQACSASGCWAASTSRTGRSGWSSTWSAWALFAYKGLWLTVVLYALFAAMSLAGWRAWHVLARARA